MILTTIWRTFISSYFALVLIPIIFQLVTFSVYSNAQNFDPVLEDKAYLNKLEKVIQTEVNATRVNFYKQAHLLDDVARQFVAAQLKENLFIALRVLAEKELARLRGNGSDYEQIVISGPVVLTTSLESENPFPASHILNLTKLASEVSTTSTPATTTLRTHVRRKRQDDGDDDGDDGDAGAAAAGGVPNRPTIPPQIGLLPQVANLVRVIFGGNGQVNFTSYVASASKLLPRPVGNQVLGLVKILTNNQNNRNSFTTANPLLAGQLPANLDLKSPAFAGLTPEQLLALGLPANGGLEGLTPEALNNLAGLAGVAAIGGAPGAGAVGAGGAGAAVALPGGLTPQDIAYLAALGIPDLPNIGQTPAPSAPRSTRKPRPSYAPQNNKNKQPQQQQNLQQQQLQSEQQLLHNQQQLQNHQQLQNQQQLQNNQQLQNQQQLQHQQQLLHQQQQLQPPPHYHQPTHGEQSFFVPTYPPSYVNGPSNYGQNPLFNAAEKDILPSNLNPNKQTLLELQQHLQAQLQQGPKYQETPQSAAQPTLFAPSSSNFSPTNNNFPPVGGSSSLPNAGHEVLNSNHLNEQQSSYFQQQSNVGQQQQEPHKNVITGGTPEQDVHTSGVIAPNQAQPGVKPQKLPSPTGGKNRRPKPPTLTPFQQQQAQLQAQQLQQLQLLQQQQQQESNAKPDRPQHQISQPLIQSEQQPLQAQRPHETQVQQHQPQFQQQQPTQSQFAPQQQPQSQFNQSPSPQSQFNQPPPQSQFNQQPPQSQFNQPPPQSQFNQQPPQSQFNQQPSQSQFNQQQQNPSFQQRPQFQTQQPTQQFQGQGPPRPRPPFQQGPQSQFQQQQQQQNQLQQKYQQQLFRPRPPPNAGIDEDESEEADTDYDNFGIGRRQGRQLNLFPAIQNLLPAILRPRPSNNNNNNNNNNINNGQQQQPPQNNNNNSNSNGNQGNNNNNNSNNGNQGNNTGSNNNNNNNNNNQNNGFDLNMFAMNLSRGMGEVARIMPDLFRGAREGLQLIQALSTILRAFPGLADALPIPI